MLSWNGEISYTDRCGTPMKCFCRLWLWVGPYPRPPPVGQRTITGTSTRRPYIATDLAAKLTIWSKARVAKSPNMISTMARPPDSASPLATPTSDCSLIGVLRTRSG